MFRLVKVVRLHVHLEPPLLSNLQQYFGMINHEYNVDDGEVKDDLYQDG
jgi:hypothetical protein